MDKITALPQLLIVTVQTGPAGCEKQQLAYFDKIR